MATSSSVSQLYGAVAQLASAESNMGSTPLLPFSPADAPRLTAQSNKLAGHGVSLRGRDPATMVQSAVDNAMVKVQAAQQMFDTVNGNPGNTLTGAIIFGAVDAAIAAVGAV
jgi:hypothetical protein